MPASATQVGHNNTDMAICFFLAWLVCLSVTIVSPAKRAEPVVMPFGMWTWMGPRNHVLDVGPDPPCEGAVFWGGGRGGPL